MRRSFNLNDLNPAQRDAVCTIDGPLLLLAGAGTGKTRVITQRIAYLVSTGIDPGSILAVTFTNKAAREMRERVGRLLDPAAADSVTAGTFHSFCARLLRKHIHSLGYSPGFAIAAQPYQLGLVRTLMAELGHAGEGKDPALWLHLISTAKCSMTSPEDLREQSDLRYAPAIAEVYGLYRQRMRQMDLLDFDDLLVLVLELWCEHPKILTEHRERYRYLLVDEYQDTNAIQFRLVTTLASDRANLCVVGDDDQSIYGWRGADLTNILQFESCFPQAKVIRLEQNYRSTETILQAANHLIAHNRVRHSKKLWSAKGAGDKIMIVGAADEGEESRFVVELLRERYLDYGKDFGKFAVLFRSNHQSRALENSLRQGRIPYTVVGTRSFFERKEILDAISLLQTVQNPRDDLSYLRVLNVPPRGLGDTAVERLRELRRITALPMQELANDEGYRASLSGGARTSLGQFQECIANYRRAFAEPGSLAAKIRGLLEDSGYLGGLGRMYKPREDALRRLENLHEFINEVAEFENRAITIPTAQEFLESIALLDTTDDEQHSAGGTTGEVTLMTVHAAKGLEFPVVVVVGMERGLFPHQRSLEEHNLEEERRLFYVALTRAQREVFLTHAQKRRVRGEMVRRRPSSFLDELPEELRVHRTPADALEPAPPEVAADYLARMMDMFSPKNG